MTMKLHSLLILVAFSSFSGVLSQVENGEHDDRELLSNIINIADMIQNAVPSVPTTPFPTGFPTYSAAPSPSPSSSPTESPTVSQQPSSEPTNYPTVSRAPTIHPTVSAKPSSSPSATPTECPSTSPTKSPTAHPTKSSQPSAYPTTSPSRTPSSFPSVSPTDFPSSSPSVGPSPYPTVSASPTLMYYESLSVNTSIPLRGISSHMNATQTLVFESITRFFIQTQIEIEGEIVVTLVQVNGQRVVKFQNEKDLIVDFTVYADYESLVHPDDFDFKRAVQSTFASYFSLYKSNLLDTGDPFFAPLDPALVVEDDSDLTPGYIAIIVASVASTICACLVAVYAIRRARAESQKGDKLSSEVPMYPSEEPVSSNLTGEEETGGENSKRTSDINNLEDGTEDNYKEQAPAPRMGPATPNKDRTTIQVETLTGVDQREGSFTEVMPTFRNQALSPSTLESGGGSRLGALAESILRSESFGSNRDPPTNSNHYLYAPKVSKGDPAAKYSTATFGVPRPDRAERFDQGNELNSRMQANLDDFNSRMKAKHGGYNPKARRDPSEVGSANFDASDINNFFNKREPEQRGVSDGRRHQAERSKASTTDRAEGASGKAAEQRSSPNKLGRKFDRHLEWPAEAGQQGRTGRTAPSKGRKSDERKTRNEPAPSSPTSSVVSSSINAFLNMVGGTLGAAPLASPAKKEKKEEKNQFKDTLQREGLYDVFAPSGALGIVVDTTKDGPAVHSLKQTSPMLGLINPGDLIVGLDEQDTRSMTAATLTRLMASKSNQKERKITLLAADY